MAKRQAFGGMMIKPDDKLAAIVGKGEVSPAEMTKRIWAYIKRNGLLSK